MEVVVCVGARYFYTVGCERCGEVCLVVYKLALARVVCVKDVDMELCKMAKEGVI